MRVTILGPGLGLSPQGDVQVHHADCPDLRRGHARRVPRKLRRTVEVGSMQDVVELVFPPDEVGWDPADENEWGRYRDEIGWFPCVQGKLPGRRPSPVMEDAAWLVNRPGFDLTKVLAAFAQWWEAEGGTLPDDLTEDEVVAAFLGHYTRRRKKRTTSTERKRP